ncbi:LysR family transcriptional regulator [Pseudokineococcus basanitobsidens]|uniref:LysR family transcriptional regulator n=1 Tax=Pseudokineococcus basanitobsidens TaxID=1926649 RepID=A0ABU8RKE6_9ACTN
MSLDPRRLLVLRAVRRAGGVLPAARALRLTPSAVSQAVTRLEQEAGVALVDRSRRGGGRSLELTSAGHALADRAEEVADALAAAERETAAHRGGASGPVRVGGFATVLRRLVAPAVGALALAGSGVVPEVVEVDETSGLRALRAGRLDLLLVERALGDDPPQRPGLAVEDLMHDAYRVVVPAAWQPPDELAELLGRPWVASPEGQAGRVVLGRLAAAGGRSPHVQHVCLEASAMLALVGAGLGAAVVTELALAYLPHPGARATAGSIDAGARVISVVHRSGRADPSPAAAAMLDALRVEVAHEVAPG